MTVPLMVDLSSNNGAPNLGAHYKAGYRTIALKATESNNYTWSAHAGLSDEWHKLGGRVVHYHFAQPGNPVGQADYFLNAVRPHLGKNDVLCLDAERGGIDGAFSRAFIDRVTSRVSVAGLIYGSPAFLNTNKVQKYKGWRLWLAEYGPRADVPSSWQTWMAWQFTDRATNVPGIPGSVDQSHVRPWLLPGLPRPAVTYPRLTFGSSGPWVHKMQDLLNTKGAHLTVDGSFGPATKTALNQFKKNHHLPVNGVCGPGAWWALTH